MKLRLITIRQRYSEKSDQELIDLVVQHGDEDAVLYLLYDRYSRSIKAWVWQCFNSDFYLEDMRNSLYIHLKGKKSNWQPLGTFRNESSFETWLKTVSIRLFLDKRDDMLGMGISKNSDINVVRVGDDVVPEPKEEYKLSDYERMVMTMEAISRLKNDDYRFVLIKELEKYNHKEIAQMLREKDEHNNVVRKYNGQVVKPNAAYVNMIKGRAIKEVKLIVEQVKKEWYECK